MKEMLATNWKTTAIGILLAGSAFVVQYGSDLGLPLMIIAVSKFVGVGGLAGLGIVSRDSKPPQ